MHEFRIRVDTDCPDPQPPFHWASCMVIDRCTSRKSTHHRHIDRSPPSSPIVLTSSARGHPPIKPICNTHILLLPRAFFPGPPPPNSLTPDLPLSPPIQPHESGSTPRIALHQPILESHHPRPPRHCPQPLWDRFRPDFSQAQPCWRPKAAVQYKPAQASQQAPNRVFHPQRTSFTFPATELSALLTRLHESLPC